MSIQPINTKVKCIRADGSTVYLQKHIAFDEVKQRKMGFYPEEVPEEEEIVVEAEEETDVEETTDEVETPELEEEEESEATAEEETEENVEEEAETDEPAEEEAPKNELDTLRDQYKEKFEKFPPKNWKPETIKTKLNA